MTEMTQTERDVLTALRDALLEARKKVMAIDGHAALNEAANVLDSALWVEDRRVRNHPPRP